MWIKEGHSDLNSSSSWWCPQKQQSSCSPSPSMAEHPGCAQHCPRGPAASRSPIRQQVVLAGHGDALIRMHSLLHDEHFHLLTVHLDGLGAQRFLAATKMREGGEVDAYLGLP